MEFCDGTENISRSAPFVYSFIVPAPSPLNA